MKGISLYQPWAWLMQLGAKRIETRSWPWPPKLLNQPTLICSTASTPKKDLAVLGSPWLRPAMMQAGIIPATVDAHVSISDPRLLKGHALAVGWPIASLITPGTYSQVCQSMATRFTVADGEQHIPPRGPERAFGNYDPRRYGILFHGLRALPDPFPIKGGQKVWNVTPADESRVIEQLGIFTPPVEAWVER